ncbi:MAG: hypothetical protein CMA88_01430 [Euryarchaeota archaeon]|nr:hypothetical protein [Euryarchaeota archaeon]|tara:strand:+ start:630 stop:1280 length:651 start_codon:yes stop_codon:yes gene_type:complete
MSGAKLLDDFLASRDRGAHRSHKRLGMIVREAYPIGVPAMIMKSSTDRLGASAGYSFHLGTPDDLLRRVASWLLTNAGGEDYVLSKLISLLWERHGREDVSLAALLLANIDHGSLGTNPWVMLSSSINPSEPAEALLLSIEELVRAGHSMPSNEMFRAWCGGRKVESHLALFSAHAAVNTGAGIDEEIIDLLASVEIPDGDSLLGRIKERVLSGRQ